ncbi:L-histidine N(alpha)-methyltransferase [Pedobacter miscanthi]|uniref:L-histidine N(Alpha)-methyltransferase n=2 Tax=Pedobacter miscanthi TaxID=2259170 RepID=A0A366L3D0_9SPHI|nr:L-histidine N(alpha)-methyltransferase [Pedobacter miscanthi]
MPLPPQKGIEEKFLIDVLQGLASSPKYLQSKYFYDPKGDKLFQDIMNCEEYYPFDCELEIFSERTAEIAGAILREPGAFDLIELGAGDCTKSSYLLEYLVGEKVDFTYMPIDISYNTIAYLNKILPERIQGLNVTGLNGEYFDMLKKAAKASSRRKVVLFMGSNLGNMPPADARLFCKELRAHLNPGDLALIGIDLKKNPHTVLAAYNDKKGITAAFNLNLLSRINRELAGDFKIGNFSHYATYDPESGGCKSFLVSKVDQQVTLSGEYEFKFAKDECIYMEISQKYDLKEIGRMGELAGFKTEENFLCRKKWFVDTVWSAI